MRLFSVPMTLAEVFAGRGVTSTSEDEKPGGLLDSGASNAMRPADPEEYRNGIPVKVTLAGEEERILRQNRQGTVLVEEENVEKFGYAAKNWAVLYSGSAVSSSSCTPIRDS